MIVAYVTFVSFVLLSTLRCSQELASGISSKQDKLLLVFRAGLVDTKTVLNAQDLLSSNCLMEFLEYPKAQQNPSYQSKSGLPMGTSTPKTTPLATLTPICDLSWRAVSSPNAPGSDDSE